MRQAIPDLLSATALEPADLDFMQAAFDQVMKERGCVSGELRSEIASAIFHAYINGERDRVMLIERGRRVVGSNACGSP